MRKVIKTTENMNILKEAIVKSGFLFLIFCTTAFLLGCACSPGIGMMLDSEASGHHIIVRLDKQKAYLYKGNMVVGISPVSTGREGYNTPAGSYHILSKDLNHRSSVYGAYVINGKIIQSGVDVHTDPCPSGADFVGAPMPYYLQIAPAYGLHAGYLPGYPASHGCIRLPEVWARRFYYASQVDTPLVIYR
jgi:lipoprotein-anchoring transpeptidase ErfK/SrfK